MKLLLLCTILLSGCATSEKGKPFVGWAISEKNGCMEKVTLGKGGLKYRNCFR